MRTNAVANTRSANAHQSPSAPGLAAELGVLCASNGAGTKRRSEEPLQRPPAMLRVREEAQRSPALAGVPVSQASSSTEEETSISEEEMPGHKLRRLGTAALDAHYYAPGDRARFDTQWTAYAQQFRQAMLEPAGDNDEERDTSVRGTMLDLARVGKLLKERAKAAGTLFGDTPHRGLARLYGAIFGTDPHAPLLETVLEAKALPDVAHRWGVAGGLGAALNTALGKAPAAASSAPTGLEELGMRVRELKTGGEERERARAVAAYVAAFRQALWDPAGATRKARRASRLALVRSACTLVRSLRNAKDPARKAHRQATADAIKTALLGPAGNKEYRALLVQLANKQGFANLLGDAGMQTLWLRAVPTVGVNDEEVSEDY